ncbi:uncharacterized protein LOC132892239 [Neoarius graeffei]|uniref:uncharacterized protein LOC132892239 n=1 Tax=Neoarius graeffei TaxID=443677 RepID=UPI00298C653F|nr:uncharacterized protein LOC132892239 [Neoarius graeffei]
MSGCCVNGCTNRYSTGGLKFHRIPKGSHPFQSNRRRLWLQAIKRVDWNEDRIKNARVCSAHFISGEMSLDSSSPDFVPSVFPDPKQSQNPGGKMDRKHKMDEASIKRQRECKRKWAPANYALKKKNKCEVPSFSSDRGEDSSVEDVLEQPLLDSGEQPLNVNTSEFSGINTGIVKMDKNDSICDADSEDKNSSVDVELEDNSASWNLIDEHEHLILSSSENEYDGEESDDNISFSDGLSKWVNQFDVKRNAVDSLLKYLQKKGHPGLPATARTLLKTPRARFIIHLQDTEDLEDLFRPRSTDPRQNTRSDNYQRKVLKRLDEIVQNQKLQMKLLKQILAEGSAAGPDVEVIEDMLEDPLTSTEELDRFCEKLANPALRKKLVTLLSAVGGHDVGDTIRRMMKKLGTFQLWSQFNMKGRKKKRSFEALPLNRVIYKACRKIHPTCKDHNIELQVAETLKHAPSKRGGYLFQARAAVAATTQETTTVPTHHSSDSETRDSC